MSIDDLKFGEIKEIAAMLGGHKAETGLNCMIGKKCIIRTYSAGVWFGEIDQKSGNEVIVKNARRMWQWKTVESISLSAVSISGIDHSKSKICESVNSVWLEAIELIPCTMKSIASIEGAEIVDAN